MKIPKKELKWYVKLPAEGKEQMGKLIHLKNYVEDLIVWLMEIDEKMELDGRMDIALQALRGVLHSIRDRLIPNEVFDLSAQLPTIIRGIFFEGYGIKGKPKKFNAREMLDRIDKSFAGNDRINPEEAFHAVLSVLKNHISDGELEDIWSGMPKDIKDMWSKKVPDIAFE